MAERKSLKEQREDTTAQLFPLALSPFEKFLLWDDTPAQPMTSFIELHFATRLNLQVLAAALRESVHLNPLLASRIVEHRSDLFWDYDASYRPRLRLEKDDPPLVDGWPQMINLRQECGSRYWYGEREYGSRLLIQLHHACTDGVGLRRVLIDSLIKYAQETGPAQIFGDSDTQVQGRGWRAPEPQRLRERFDFTDAFRGAPKRPLSFGERVKNAYYFHFQLPEPLAGSCPMPSAFAKLNPLEPLRHVSIARDQSRRIFELATQQGTSVNELGLALLFQTCARWNRLRVSDNPQRRIRLLMPFDLRSRVDLRMPAANRLSFAFLGRRQEECDDLGELVLGVHREVQAIRDSHLPLDFLNGVSAAARCPQGMKWALRQSNRMATAVLTYAGDVLRGTKKLFREDGDCRIMGDARLRNTFVAPPVRRNTNISIGLCINWGQLCLSAAWNRQEFSADDCEEFLQQYRSAWLDWLAESNP